MKFRQDQVTTAKMGLLVLSHKEVSEFVPERGACVLIRIINHETDFLSLPARAMYRDILKLQFDDVEGPDSRFYKGIEDDQARAIVRFLLNHREKNLVVHCEAGISRSGAVGAFWAEINDKERVAQILWDSKGWYFPNRRVFNALRDSLQQLDQEKDGA